MKLNGYSISKRAEKGIVKSPCVWGTLENNSIVPLIYMKKPKWMSEETFNKIIDSIKLDLVCGFELKHYKEEKQSD